MSRNRVVSAFALGAVTLAVVALETIAGRRFSRRLAHAVTRKARYQCGQLAGFRYRLAGRQPDPGAESRVLADRIRSTLDGHEGVFFPGADAVVEHFPVA